MYINKIDDLIDKIVDDFSNYLHKKNKKFAQVLKEQNFVKYQLEINDVLKTYVSQIDISDIEIGSENEDKIYQILSRYLAYYLFLTIAYFYSGKKETFVNNLIEFSKNQPTFKMKINDFFNSENNGNILKYFDSEQNEL